jgi:hypothetical protein
VTEPTDTDPTPDVLSGGPPMDPRTYPATLTGFDEIALVKAFGSAIEDLSATMASRAMLFTYRRRLGDDDRTAYETAMNITLHDLEPCFEVNPVVQEDPMRDFTASTPRS